MLTRFPAGMPVRVTSISAGFDFVLALTRQGRVYGWGSNRFGQLGFDPSITVSGPDPHPVPGISIPVSAISAGGQHGLALAANGTTLLGWGANQEGQLGDGTTPTSRFTPMPVKLGLEPGVRVRSASAGAFHSVALTTAGSVLAWGFNSQGQLGIGSRSDSIVPIMVKLPQLAVRGKSVPDPVFAIAAGPISDNSYAIIAALPRT